MICYSKTSLMIRNNVMFKEQVIQQNEKYSRFKYDFAN